MPVKTIWHGCDLEIYIRSLKVVCMGKAQWGIPLGKVWHSSHLECPRKITTPGQPAGWHKADRYIVSHFSCKSKINNCFTEWFFLPSTMHVDGQSKLLEKGSLVILANWLFGNPAVCTSPSDSMWPRTLFAHGTQLSVHSVLFTTWWG